MSTTATIDTPLGPVEVSYGVGTLDYAAQREHYEGGGTWRCRMTLAHPGKGAAPWHIIWNQSDDYVWGIEGAREDSDGGTVYIDQVRAANPWRPTLDRLRAEVAPVIAAWADTPEADAVRRASLVRKLRNERAMAEGRIGRYTQQIADERAIVAAVDAWLSILGY